MPDNTDAIEELERELYFLYNRARRSGLSIPCILRISRKANKILKMKADIESRLNLGG